VTRLLFIIGTGRCGSTMLQEVMARHPDVGFMSNLDVNLPRLHLMGRRNNHLYRLTPAGFGQRDRRGGGLVAGRVRFGPSEAYRLLAHEVSPMLADPCRDLTEDDVTPWLERRARRFFEVRMAAQSKALFLCKFAGWPRARFLHGIFPEARFVHMIRDGRAVADSLMRRPWWDGHRGPTNWRLGPLPDAYQRAWEAAERSFVALAGIHWSMLMDAYQEARSRIPPEQWIDVRYEELVERPRAVMGGILELAGLPWNRDFEAQFRRYEFSPERAQEYRANLTPEQLRVLERTIGPALERLGYLPHSEGLVQSAP
jgi:Sulfotransferase family